MFESRPSQVPAPLSEAVAEDPSRWGELLRAARPSRPGQGRVEPTARESVVSDVPTSVWQNAFLDPEMLYAYDDMEDALTAETMARTVLDAAGVELRLLDVPRTPYDVDPWPCLGAALLEPYVSGVLPHVVGPRDRAVLRELGDVIAEPAAAVCRLAVTQLFDAA